MSLGPIRLRITGWRIGDSIAPDRPRREPNGSGHSMNRAAVGWDAAPRSSLQDSELRYRRLFESARDGILILDARSGAITDVNPYLIELLGYSREEFLAKRLWEVGAFRDIQSSKDAFLALQEREYIRYKDLPLRTKDGRLVPVEFVSNVYMAGTEKVIQCNIRDISERKHAQDALERSEALYREQSVRDHLTGLYNRRYMEETLTRELLRASRRQVSVGVIMLDVDDFKRINDTHGARRRRCGLARTGRPASRRCAGRRCSRPLRRGRIHHDPARHIEGIGARARRIAVPGRRSAQHSIRGAVAWGAYALGRGCGLS